MYRSQVSASHFWLFINMNLRTCCSRLLCISTIAKISVNEEEFRMKGGTKVVKISTSMKKYFYDPSEVEAEDGSVA